MLANISNDANGQIVTNASFNYVSWQRLKLEQVEIKYSANIN